MDIKKNKKLLVIGALVALLIIIFGVAVGKNLFAKGGPAANDSRVGFYKVSKSNHRTLWYVADGYGEVTLGMHPKNVVEVQNGKMKVFNTKGMGLDMRNINKMSDNEILNKAEKQDKFNFRSSNNFNFTSGNARDYSDIARQKYKIRHLDIDPQTITERNGNKFTGAKYTDENQGDFSKDNARRTKLYKKYISQDQKAINYRNKNEKNEAPKIKKYLKDYKGPSWVRVTATVTTSNGNEVTKEEIPRPNLYKIITNTGNYAKSKTIGIDTVPYTKLIVDNNTDHYATHITPMYNQPAKLLNQYYIGYFMTTINGHYTDKNVFITKTNNKHAKAVYDSVNTKGIKVEDE